MKAPAWTIATGLVAGWLIGCLVPNWRGLACFLLGAALVLVATWEAFRPR